jgi:flagellar hook-associated protein 2
MITAAGVGSGIDVESIISQLMQIEQRPVNVLEERKQDNTTELSDVGKLRSSLDELQAVVEKIADPDEFGAYTAESSDEDILIATSTSGQFPENHSLEVTALATHHRVISASYASPDDSVGTGTYSFSSASESFSVTLDASSHSLFSLRDAINNSADNSTIQATILNTDAGSQLVLTAVESGTDNSITSPAQFTELTAAQDAEFTINGLDVTSNSNTVTSVVSGLTLDLKSTGTVNINSARSIDSLKALFEEFAAAYNNLRNTISEVGTGTLQGDSLLRRIESGLREEFFNATDLGDGNGKSLFDLGFSVSKTGVLTVDSDELDDAINGGISQLISAFTTEDTGIAERLTSRIDLFTSTGGFFDLRDDAIAERNRLIDYQIERLEYRIEQTEFRYREQFTAMDSMVSQLQSNGNYLNQALSSL